MIGVGDWLYERSQICSERVAIVYKERRLTYEELNNRTNRLANGLRQLGVRKGDRVAAMLTNGNEIIEGLFACAKVGAVFLPINSRLSTGEVGLIFCDGASPKVVIYSERFSELIEQVCSRIPVRHRIQVGGRAQGMEYETFLTAHSGVEPQGEIDEEEVHLIIYTSGSTGSPKGVMLTHSNTYWNIRQVLNAEPLFGTDTTLTVAPLFHIAAMTILTLPLLYIGGTVVIHEKFDPVEVLRTIIREKVTCIFMVPAMWRSVIQLTDSNLYDLSSVRFGVSAGAPCPIYILKYFQARGLPLIQALGMTEVAPIAILEARDAERKIGSVGKPASYTRIRIVSNDYREVSGGGIGELAVRSPSVMKGYCVSPETVQETFQDGWFYTGDLVRIDEEGYIYVAGRKKDMIISGGENVYPAEVEQVLYSHPQIKEVAVIGVPDDKWGESVKAVIALKDSTCRMTMEDIRAFCEGKIANYKIPRSFDVVDALPRNSMGKPLKNVFKGIGS